MILVTGGAGFVGRALCTLLHKRGLEILAVDRCFDVQPEYEFTEGDLNTPSFLSGLFSTRSCKSVVHLASILKTASERNPEQALQTNVGGSLRLIELAASAGVSRFIYGSSISAYGTKRFAEHGKVHEAELTSPEDVYGIGKRYVEIAGQLMSEQSNMDFVSLRIPIVVGKGVEGSSSPWRSEIFEPMSASGPHTVEIPFSPDEMIPLSHVEDVAGAIHALLELEEIPANLYNSPTENWVCKELCDYIRGMQKQFSVAFGNQRVEGIPQAIDDRTFRRDTSFLPVSLVERLRSSAVDTTR